MAYFVKNRCDCCHRSSKVLHAVEIGYLRLICTSCKSILRPTPSKGE